MKIAFLAVIGLALGAVIGGAVAVGAGLACVGIFKVSDFEGGSGMMVGLIFMPLGTLGIGCAIWVGILAGRPGQAKQAAGTPMS